MNFARMAKQSDKRSKAKSLYLTGQYSQKEIADLVGTSERSISTWKEAEDWDSLKISLLTTRENELRRLYKMLQLLNDDIDLTAELKIPVNSKQADAVLKLTQAIKNLELETSIADKVEVGSDFINLVRKDDPEFAKKATKWFDIYIQQSLR
jgi:DNA-binding transcriptional regulator LsrR (DeoR family)